MKKRKRRAFGLSGKTTDEEIIQWTESHDVFYRLRKGVSEVVEDHRDLDDVFVKLKRKGRLLVAVLTKDTSRLSSDAVEGTRKMPRKGRSGAST